MDRVTAVVPAAGLGKRMGVGSNKLYLDMEGRPVLAWTLQVLEDSPVIEQVILVVHSSEVDNFRDKFARFYGFLKIAAVLPGGKERQDSVYRGLCSLPENTSLVVVHDGARPLLTSRVLKETVAVAGEYGAAVTAVPVKDTIKMVEPNGFVAETLDRQKLWAVQTPQVFRRDLLWEAHLQARRDGFYGTDDSVLVERYGFPVKVVNGSYENIKITTPDDLLEAKTVLQRRKTGAGRVRV